MDELKDLNINEYLAMSEEERDAYRQKRLEEAKREKKKRIRNRRITYVLICLVFIAGIYVGMQFSEEITDFFRGFGGPKQEQTVPSTEADPETTEAAETEAAATEEQTEAQPQISVDDTLARADRLAAMYDYDGAMEALQQADPENEEYKTKIAEYTAAKEACVAVDVETVPHVFFHSLINDDRGFRADVCGEFQAKDNACWMVTANEFTAILQQMYDAGYVMVSLHDLVTPYTNDSGNKRFRANTELMLPAGKKAFVMSEDDLSYYHVYGNQGIASKLVLDEQGKVKCEYINASGETLVGDYDVVPLLDAFVEEHPDFSYHGAKAMIALTGYNGVFGYRTDTVYNTRDPERLDPDQKDFLDANPNFDFDQEVAEATKIAEALKANGWEFASHTWGHRHADQASLESLQLDNSRWVESVQPIVGPVDTIIFAHGGDIGGSEPYTYDNAKYEYYKESGYDFYCNVDGSDATTLAINGTHVRQGRIDLDGYYLWKVMNGNTRARNVFDYLGIHDVESFFDYNRITPVEVMG